MPYEIYLEETFQVGIETFIPCDSKEKPYAVVFEDDSKTGCFYACTVDKNGQSTILDTLHIYNVENIVDKNIPSVLTIGWSQIGKQAILLINKYPHTVFDFINQKAYCRTGFPPVTENQWCQNDRQWDEQVLEFFK